MPGDPSSGLDRDAQFDIDVRVLHVINSLERGGAETNLARLCAATARCGVANTVVTLKGGGALRDQVARDARVVPLANVGEATELLRRWSSAPPDLVVGWMYHGCVVASMLTRRSIPVIWSLRHVPDDLSRESRTTRASLRVLRRFSASARFAPRAIVTNSAAARDSHVALGLRGEYCVINNGVDTGRFSPDASQRAAYRSANGIGADDLVLLHVARNHPHKGHNVLFDVAEPLLRRFSSVRLVLVGDGVESIRHPLLNDPALSARVLRYGGREDLLPLYRCADLLINPSLTESFPTAVAEAMSCSVPCVVTDVGDARELVGGTGEVVAPGSVDALQRGLERMLLRSSEERRQLGAEARLRILERFTIEQMAAAFVGVYRSVSRRVRS
jgi:glycosyltransferase involved in cell wall biosynthesis